MSLEDIKLISAVEAIQLRPELYVDDPKGPGAVNCLLQEALCLPLENAIGGCATRIDISIDQQNTVTVAHDGKPFHLSRSSPTIQTLLTALFACRETKSSESKSLCKTSVVVNTALSEFLTYECAAQGYRWKLSYSHGVESSPLTRGPEDSSEWESLLFRPSKRYFDHTAFDMDQLHRWYRDLGIELRGATVRIKTPSDPSGAILGA